MILGILLLILLTSIKENFCSEILAIRSLVRIDVVK